MSKSPAATGSFNSWLQYSFRINNKAAVTTRSTIVATWSALNVISVAAAWFLPELAYFRPQLPTNGSRHGGHLTGHPVCECLLCELRIRAQSIWTTGWQRGGRGCSYSCDGDLRLEDLCCFRHPIPSRNSSAFD